jgi:hypothetical protein
MTACVDHSFKQIIDPEEIVTWVHIRKSEEVSYKESSWSNPQEEVACSRICKNLLKLPALFNE